MFLSLKHNLACPVFYGIPVPPIRFGVLRDVFMHLVTINRSLNALHSHSTSMSFNTTSLSSSLNFITVYFV